MDSTPTRRRFVRGSAAAAAGAALAGCTADGGDGSDDPTTTSGQDSYTVTMAPVGEVGFDAAPESWSTYFPGYADMGVALGQADGLSAIGNAARYYTSYYDELDGVSVDESSITELLGESGIDRERYLAMGNDVHLTDPEWLISNGAFGLDGDDIDQITEQVGPFVGNTIFRRTDAWHDYRYYTLYEAFETVATVFQQKDRYDAFASLHDDFVASLQTDLPPARERPNGLLCYAAADQPEQFSPYRLEDKGTNKKPFRDLGIADALAGTGVEGLSESNRQSIDYETLLTVDPDVLLVRGHETKSPEEFEETVLAFMRDHEVASQLTAVENGDVYRGGPIYLGPIQHLFVTERFATRLFPDTFSGELFDRDDLADVIAGSA